MSLKLIGGLAAAAVLALSLPAHAQFTWGGTASGLWNVPGNWVGGVGPANGAPTTTFTFPASPNQAVSLNIGPVTLNSLTTSAAYAFSGDPFEFNATAGGATLTSGGGPLAFANDVGYSVPLTILANTDITFGLLVGFGGGLVKQGAGLMTVATFNTNAPVAVQAGTLIASPGSTSPTRTLTISAGANVNTGPASWGALSGAGNLALGGNTTFNQGANNTTFTGNVAGGAFNFSKSGTGTLVLLGNNTYTGTTVASAGRLEVGNGTSGTFANGPVSVNNGATLALNPTNAAVITTMSVGTTGVVEVNGGTLTDSGGGWSFPGNLTVNGGAVTTTFIGIAGTLTVNAPGSFTMVNGGNVAGLTGSGSVVVTNAALFTVNNAANFTFSGAISGAGSFIKDGAGTLTLSGVNTYTGQTSVGGGLLLVNGTVPGAVFLGAGSAVGGTGTIVGMLDAPLGSTVRPGVSPGILNTGNLNMVNSTFQVEVLGNAPGTGYDQLNVTGTVNVTNTTLALSGAYAPAAGDTFVIVNNDGADAVTGTFAGLPEGATIVLNGRTLAITYMGGTGNDITLAPLTATITASAGSNGTIAPTGSVPVAQGGTTTFTVTPATGFSAVMGGTCPAGALVGTTYTTGTITTNCTVTASFTLNSYTVTSSAGANGTIAPLGAVPVNHGATTVFTVTPNATYSASVGGTCGGNLAGTTFTTNPITGPCTVIASFSQNTFTVTPSAGPNGTITPNTPQTVVQNGTATFTLAPNAGYAPAVFGSCGGTLVGNTFTTNAITANCTVFANFDLIPVKSFTGPTATGTGNATVSFTGGGTDCSFAPQGTGAMQSAFFIPVTGHAKSPPAGTAPPGILFAHGLLDFVLLNCTQASTVAFTVTYPSALAPGTQYWKYGPEPGNATPHWYVLPSTVTGNVVTFSITDGGRGDDDLLANAIIVDQGGPGIPLEPNAQRTPTLSEWAMLLLATMMLAFGMASTRRRRVVR